MERTYEQNCFNWFKKNWPKLNKKLKTIQVVQNIKSLKNEGLIIIATKIESLDTICKQLKQLLTPKFSFFLSKMELVLFQS